MTNKQVSYYSLRIGDDCVFITKRKRLLLAKRFLFFLGLLLIGGLVLWSLLAKSPNAFKKTIDFNGWLFLAFVATILSVHLIFSIIRFLRVVTDFEICKRPSLTVNGSQLFDTCNKEVFIVIQNVGAVGSIGGSFTVGIARGRKFFGLCYELKKEHAREIAEFLAENLGYRIEYREAIFFPLFKLH
jgi:hypothetical protein